MVVLISFTSIRKNICNYCWLVAGIEVMLIYTFLSFVIQLLFLSFEMMLLLMCFSVSTWGTKLYKIRSSFYLFVFTVFGGIFWVICTVTLSLITGSNNYILDFSVNLNQQISFALMFLWTDTPRELYSREGWRWRPLKVKVVTMLVVVEM